MKHVYPPRHPASLDAPATAARGNVAEPAVVHGRDASGQGAAGSQRRATGRPAHRGDDAADRRRGQDTPTR